jgi:glycerophosphoryl diester phosphodiesterase
MLMKRILHLILLVLFISGCTRGKNTSFDMPERGICAHRGAMDTHPENTLAAFKEAVRLGAHMIEFDVRMTMDGHLVILHDETVDRTSKGRGKVSELSLDEVKQLDAGSWKSAEFAGEKIPTLKEALAVMPADIWLNVHLKGGAELGEKVARVILEENREHQTVIACGAEAARAAKNISTDILICNMERQGNREVYIDETIRQESQFIQLLGNRTGPNLDQEIARLKQHDIKVNYCCTDAVEEVESLFRSGVDFILTDKLSEMLEEAAKLEFKEYPLGKPGLSLGYSSKQKELPGSVVREFELVLGAVEIIDGIHYQWLQLNAEKENSQTYSLWILTSAYPSPSREIAQQNILRYLLSSDDSEALEFTDQSSGNSVLPGSGVWEYLLPRSANGNNPIHSPERIVKYLGLEYQLESRKQSIVPAIPHETHCISLTPDLLIGVPHNSKMKDETRRYDESDYEYVLLTEDNYSEMIRNGMNVFNVNSRQLKWIEKEDVYYWGIGGEDISYPESLYRSNYLGQALFMDEPMVHTRDHALRPKFKTDPSLRLRINPQLFFEEFKKEYHKSKYEGFTVQLLKGLANRPDVDIGDMDFLQANVYSWETMVSSAIYQLSEGDRSPPSAMVFEPPGRYGARRVIPELNMCFDCQIPVDDPHHLFGIIKGFLRGAARLTGKEWGVSIYGQVDRADAGWLLSHTYDMGGTHFFYWDTYQLAAVPYNEYLSLSRHLREYARNSPKRDLIELKHAAETAILIPPGYNLGHVKMGIGNLSGLPELNMERRNSHGIKYREVMSNLYTEIERCIRLGVKYDLFWNLVDLEYEGYREIITIREDGKVEILSKGKRSILDSARIPERPEGLAPQLSVELKPVDNRSSGTYRARATVTAGDAPVYYTQGANKEGVYLNSYVLWELYGPGEADYTDFWNDRWEVSVTEENNTATVEFEFSIEQSGSYRLRASTSDAEGRSSVVWKEIKTEL